MENIIYTDDLTGITPESLSDFFVGWPNPPSTELLHRLLHNSSVRVIALDSSLNKVVGYVTALTDGVLFGYISSLEVLPDYQCKGIGKKLMSDILERLGDVYAVDLVCDPDVQPFYEKCGMRPCSAMIIRRYDKLSGE